MGEYHHSAHAVWDIKYQCAVKREVNAAGESPAQGSVGTPW
jgi:hypothetical protein